MSCAHVAIDLCPPDVRPDYLELRLLAIISFCIGGPLLIYLGIPIALLHGQYLLIIMGGGFLGLAGAIFVHLCVSYCCRCRCRLRSGETMPLL